MMKTKGVRRSITMTMITAAIIITALGTAIATAFGTGTNRGWYYNYPGTYSGNLGE